MIVDAFIHFLLYDDVGKQKALSAKQRELDMLLDVGEH
jgi:hypothetical protein